MTRPIVGVCGPYTAPTKLQIERNIRRASLYAAAINRTGLAYAMCPHLLSHEIEASLDESHWVAFTLEMSRRCDGLLFIPGWSESRGAIGEFNRATVDNRPWFSGVSLEKVEDAVLALIVDIESRARKPGTFELVPPEVIA